MYLFYCTFYFRNVAHHHELPIKFIYACNIVFVALIFYYTETLRIQTLMTA